jgi:hypothetical protein
VATHRQKPLGGGICKICNDPNKPLSPSNTTGQHRYYCLPAGEEKPYAKMAFDPNLVLRAVYKHFEESQSDLFWSKVHDSEDFRVRRRIAVYLLSRDAKLLSHQIAPFTGRAHVSFVVSSLAAAENDLVNLQVHIDAIRKLYVEVAAKIKKESASVESPPQPTG